MSVGGCYTDFHVDFGGTSVWYHILHGKKVSVVHRRINLMNGFMMHLSKPSSLRVSMSLIPYSVIG